MILRNLEKGALEKGYLHKIVRNLFSTLTLLFFIFRFPCFLCFPIFLAFFARFSLFSKDFRGFAKREPLHFSGFPFFPNKQGLEGQGNLQQLCDNFAHPSSHARNEIPAILRKFGAHFATNLRPRENPLFGICKILFIL